MVNSSSSYYTQDTFITAYLASKKTPKEISQDEVLQEYCKKKTKELGLSPSQLFLCLGIIAFSGAMVGCSLAFPLGIPGVLLFHFGIWSGLVGVKVLISTVSEAVETRYKLKVYQNPERNKAQIVQEEGFSFFNQTKNSKFLRDSENAKGFWKAFNRLSAQLESLEIKEGLSFPLFHEITSSVEYLTPFLSEKNLVNLQAKLIKTLNKKEKAINTLNDLASQQNLCFRSKISIEQINELKNCYYNEASAELEGYKKTALKVLTAGLVISEA